MHAMTATFGKGPALMTRQNKGDSQWHNYPNLTDIHSCRALARQIIRSDALRRMVGSRGLPTDRWNLPAVHAVPATPGP